MAFVDTMHSAIALVTKVVSDYSPDPVFVNTAVKYKQAYEAAEARVAGLRQPTVHGVRPLFHSLGCYLILIFTLRGPISLAFASVWPRIVVTLLTPLQTLMVLKARPLPPLSLPLLSSLTLRLCVFFTYFS
jgi:hypothetical protein